MRILQTFFVLSLVFGSASAEATPIWVAGFDQTIRKIDEAGTTLATLPVGFIPGAVEYDESNDKLYFGFYVGPDNSNMGAWSMNGDGTGLTQIFSTSGTPFSTRSVGVDPINGFLFIDVIGGDDDGVWRMELDGSNATKIDTSFVTGSIAGLKPDPYTQTLYIADYFGEHSLKTMDYNGGSNSTLLTGLNGNLHEIDIDHVNQKLYIVSNFAGPIYRSNLDGTGLEVFADGFSNPVGVAVDPVGGYVFIGEADGGVERLNLDGTGRIQITSSPGSFGLALAGSQFVPEPSTALLLYLGLVGLGRLRRQ